MSFTYLGDWLRFNAPIIEALATVAIAAFTIVLVCISRRDAKDTKVIERAYVNMSHIPPGIQLIDGDGPMFIVRLEVKNFGNTPAEITDILIRPKILLSGEELPDVPPYERRRIQQSFSAHLVAGEAFIYQDPDVFNFGDENKEPIRKAEKTLYIFGYVDYIDKFRVRHRTGYARVYWPPIINDSPNNLMFVTKRGYNYDRPRKRGEGNDWDQKADLFGGPRIGA